VHSYPHRDEKQSEEREKKIESGREREREDRKQWREREKKDR
jgi:hypothetical protein